MNKELVESHSAVKMKLTSLWMCYFLSHIYRGFHEFGNQDFVDGMVNGVINGVEMTDTLLIFGWIMIAPQLILIPATQFLNAKICRLAHLFVGSYAILMSVIVYMSPDIDDVLFAFLEITSLLLVMKHAWIWKEVDKTNFLHHKI